MMIIDGQKNYKKIRVQKPFMNDHMIHQSNYNPTTKIFENEWFYDLVIYSGFSGPLWS